MSLVSVDNLSIRYPEAEAHAVGGVSFAIDAGEAVGLVGESGSGKTQTALAIMGLLPTNATVKGGIDVSGTAVIGASDKTMRQIRAKKIGMVFQDPGLSLNPYLRIGDQLGRVIREHNVASGSNARSRALELLQMVGLPDPKRQLRCYPHQLSGGMRQRVMIAAALVADPDLLIADEPTTALDVTVQAQILGLLKELRERSNTAMLLITHDLGVIAGTCDRMLVLEHGKLIEQGTTMHVFTAPATDATRKMIAAGSWGRRNELAVVTGETTLSVQDLSVSFPQQGRWSKKRLDAVMPLSFSLNRGETLAIVGESGSGKTSLARAMLGLIPDHRGTISYLGRGLANAVSKRPRRTLRQLQMVFQDPLGSLNPAMRVSSIVGEPLWIHEPDLSTEERTQAAADMLVEVGLEPAMMDRFPHELSGGQAQRVAIARALIVKPSVLVCDEAVAALDNTIKRDILALLKKEQDQSNLAILFISHDLGIVRQISDRVIVLYMGHIVEEAETETLFSRPGHPYTRALIDAIPVADPDAQVMHEPISGEVSSLSDPPSGCVFHPRCRYAKSVCSSTIPPLTGSEPARVACHRSPELDLTRSRG